MSKSSLLWSRWGVGVCARRASVLVWGVSGGELVRGHAGGGGDDGGRQHGNPHQRAGLHRHHDVHLGVRQLSVRGPAQEESLAGAGETAQGPRRLEFREWEIVLTTDEL